MSEFNVSNETKKAILTQRLGELNIEGYNNEIALNHAKSVDNAEQITNSESTIQLIKSVIKTLEEELAKLD